MQTRKKPLLSEIEREWYKKLKDDGFEDIEDSRHPDRPLFSYHSFKFVSEAAQLRKVKRASYQIQIDLFVNHESFSEAIERVIAHGNCIFDESGVKYIWELHRNGTTEREIAREMRCSQTGIHFLLKRVKAWMALV